MNEYRVICIDDDEQFLRSLENAVPRRVEALCRDFQCAFEFVASPEELFEVISDPSQSGHLAMIISDQMMTGTTGIELIEKLKVDYPDIVSILLTGHAGLDSAKYAINRQLLDQYVSKPIEDIQVFVSLVTNLLKRYHLDLAERERTEQLANTVVQLQTSNEEISAMQTAAEDIAMLAKGFEGMELDQVVAAASREVPRIFQAHKALLFLAPEDGSDALIGRDECSCELADVLLRDNVKAALEKSPHRCDDHCKNCGELPSQSDRVIVPLAISPFVTGTNSAEGRRGFLCLCNLDPEVAECTTLTKYKVGLAGEVLSAGLTNATLYQRAKRDSETDHLTGASTRRVMEEKLRIEHDRATRYEHPFCVIIVDVDCFKSINDKFGHIAGDQTLQELTGILESQMRKTDTLARYGGDEFAILMPETEIAEAITAAERMRAQAEAALTPGGDQVTISCGVAGWNGEENGMELLHRADTALYKAKLAGKNSVHAEQTAA